MKITKIITTFLAIAFFSLPAFAAEDKDAFVVIRFSNDNISYEKMLQKAVSTALRTKPSVFFDVVSIVPTSKDSDNNEKAERKARRNASSIKTQIETIGVPSEKIRISYQKKQTSKFNEVHIFIR